MALSANTPTKVWLVGFLCGAAIATACSDRGSKQSRIEDPCVARVQAFSTQSLRLRLLSYRDLYKDCKDLLGVQSARLTKEGHDSLWTFVERYPKPRSRLYLTLSGGLWQIPVAIDSIESPRRKRLEHLADSLRPLVQPELVAERRQREVQGARARAVPLQDRIASFRFSSGSPCPSSARSRVVNLTMKNPSWSDDMLVLVACRGIRIGMTREQLIASRGRPSSINRTIGSWGVHEQWVYGDLGPFIYLEDGLLTSWQD